MIPISKPNKSHAEIVNELRTKVVKLQELGVLDGPGAELYQNQLLSMLSEVERKREASENEAQKWLEKYHFALGKRDSFTTFRSMIENLLNAHISRAQAEIEHEKALKEEDKDRVDPGPNHRCEECNRGGFRSQRALSMHKVRSHKKKNRGGT